MNLRFLYGKSARCSLASRITSRRRLKYQDDALPVE